MHVEGTGIASNTDKIHDGDTALALFDNLADMHESFEPGEEKKLVRKIDLMILPFLAVCYAFYYIDKTTLSYAAIFGIKEDLNISGDEYSWLSSVFYFGFLFWSLPTNLLMQRFPIGKYLGINIFLWGFFLMLQASAKNFTQLTVLRVISGAAEASSDPAFMLITSMWYTRRQQPIRIGLWYTANGFGIAIGGLLGYGIGQIKGALPSWKYEFLIIGALCTAWGIIMFIFLPDSPVTAPQLSDREKRLAVERLRDNQTGIENKNLKPRQILEAISDWKVWIFFLLGFSGNIPNGGISNFGTLIIKGFGFTTSGHTKKVITNAMIFLGVCAGNISGPFFYKSSQSPGYSLGIWSMIVANFVEIALIVVLGFGLAWENRRRDRAQGISPSDGGNYTRELELDQSAFSDLTDKENLNFRHIY
ncbi:hypothetical protein N7488_009571 [Penicillium malachiteum]|nr:hypothetical protein N7488_009571 [Penicillium malachiteum]